MTGECYSHKCCWRVFSGQTGKGLRAESALFAAACDYRLCTDGFFETTVSLAEGLEEKPLVAETLSLAYRVAEFHSFTKENPELPTGGGNDVEG